MMTRAQLLEMERSCAERTVRYMPSQGMTLRADAPGAPNEHAILFEGWSCVTEYGYDMYGGPPYGWTELVSAGAFRKTLSERADVQLLFQHDSLPLARTAVGNRAGTMTLEEDAVGEHVLAWLDSRVSLVADLAIILERGDMDQMSMAVRVVRQRWEDLEGNEADPMIAPVRRLLELNQHRGDVSIVRYGANDAAGGTFREVDMALTELRAGRVLAPERVVVLREWLAGLDVKPAEATPVPGMAHARALRELELLKATG